MWWSLIVSLMSDSRIRFLLWFIVVAIIISIILILIEINMKRRNELRLLKLKQKSPLDKIRNFLKSKKNVSEKLSFIDKSAKEYFKKIYGTSRNSSYSELIEKFKKKNKRNELAFCRSMFEAYYSYKKLEDKQAVFLGNALITIEEIKNKADEISMGSTPIDRLYKLFSDIGTIFFNIKSASDKKIKKIIKDREGNNKLLKKVKTSKPSVKKIISHTQVATQKKSIKRVVPILHPNKIYSGGVKKQSIFKEFIDNIVSFFRAIKNNKPVKSIEGEYARISNTMKHDKQKRRQWVRETISRGYSKKKVSSLLSNWTKNFEDRKNILNMYNEEYAAKIKQQNSVEPVMVHHINKKNTENGIGIAGRIIKNEKERLRKKGIFD